MISWFTMLAAAAVQVPSVERHFTDIPITSQGDDFDQYRSLFAPEHEINSTWSYYAAGKVYRSGKLDFIIVIKFNGISGGGIDTGTLETANFRGGRAAIASIGDARSRGCLRENCFFVQTMNISIPASLITPASKDIEVKVSTDRGFSQIISISTDEFRAIAHTAKL